MYFIVRICSVCCTITVQQTLTRDKRTYRTGYDTHVLQQPILAGTSTGRTGGSPGAQREKLLYTEDEKISLCLEFSSE